MSQALTAKQCIDCRQILSLTAFSPNGGGHYSSYCRPCKNARHKQWCEQNPERLKSLEHRSRENRRETIRGRSREYYHANPEKVKAAVRKWGDDNHDRRRIAGNAKSQVRRAIKAGKLTRPDRCSACSDIGPIEAAHYDYSKPLEVVWLCRPCHRAWDRHQPKTIGASA